MGKRIFMLVSLISATCLLIGISGCNDVVVPAENNLTETIIESPVNENGLSLTLPMVEEGPVAEALYKRVSRRSYSDQALQLSQVGSLLWSAGGINVDGLTGPTRTSPSAGARYPLDIYLVAGNVEGLEAGIYRYDYENHALEPVVLEDRRLPLAEAALGQGFIADAPVVIALVAYFERTTSRYGDRGERYVYMDAGYASQSVYLMAEELSLGTVAVGAFDDVKIKDILETEGSPLLIMPVGDVD